jgi:hypothetical protein
MEPCLFLHGKRDIRSLPSNRQQFKDAAFYQSFAQVIVQVADKLHVERDIFAVELCLEMLDYGTGLFARGVAVFGGGPAAIEREDQ